MNQKQPKILIIGDCILDQYYWTSVSRISPEAPVPVCHVQKTTNCLGGAGNVAHNLACFGVDVSLSGIIGNDDNGKLMLSYLKKAGINSDGIIASNKVPTISKSRVIAKNQQLCRLDHEDLISNIDQEIDACIDYIIHNLIDFSCVIISDYKKGVISEKLSQQVIQKANQNNVPVIVDPKGRNIQKYSGATYLTPNMSEFSEFVMLEDSADESEITKKAQQLSAEYNIENIIITRSEKGISMVTKSDKKDFPTKAKEISDVTGAGDTVIAAIAYGISLHWEPTQIMSFANHAAGVVVSKVGTATATLEEINAYESNL